MCNSDQCAVCERFYCHECYSDHRVCLKKITNSVRILFLLPYILFIIIIIVIIIIIFIILIKLWNHWWHIIKNYSRWLTLFNIENIYVLHFLDYLLVSLYSVKFVKWWQNVRHFLSVKNGILKKTAEIWLW